MYNPFSNDEIELGIYFKRIFLIYMKNGGYNPHLFFKTL